MSEEAAVARQWSAETKKLGDTIVGLSLLQAKELADYLELVHGIKAAAAAAVVAGPAAGAGAEAAEEAEVKTEFDVVLKAIGDKKIQVIKALRANTDLGLKEAKDLVEKAPTTVMEGVEKEKAEKAQKELEEAGATVVLE